MKQIFIKSLSFAFACVQVLLYSSLFIASAFSDASPAENFAACDASVEYLFQQENNRVDYIAEPDLSCLVDIPSISARLGTYQLVDTRRNKPTAIENAWQISVSQLKNKFFLKERKLLLIGESFGRAQEGAECAILKKAGFHHAKILLGGIDTWQKYQINSRQPKEAYLGSVTAQQVLHEYFNHGLVFVATSERLAKKLQLLGFKDVLVSEPIPEKISSLVVAQSGGGFYSVILVSDTSMLEFPSHLSNLYQLSGGVDSLSEQIHKNTLANYARTVTPERFVCGKF